LYEGVLGLAAGQVEYVADQKVNVLVLMAGEQRIELVEPVGEDSPVAKFIERNGGGLHHLAWRVTDLDQALGILKGRGVRLIDQEPRQGAHHTRIAFVHPKATGGVLMELVEDPAS
jgi:methylmalonyl-CoA/ethylmalonyl-CoA epimerase